MKSLTTQLALSFTLALGSISNALAADIDYQQTGPIFTQDAYLVGGIGEVDTFYFTSTASSGTYNFYSLGPVDTYGYLWSDTYGYLMDSNDDGVAAWGGFCVDGVVLTNEAITIAVQGYDNTSQGDYTIVGASGTCADSAAAGFPDPTATSSDSGAFGLPAILFTILGLGAVRLRRFFA